MNKASEQGAVARSTQHSRQRLRDIARLWISSLRALYSGDAPNINVTDPVMGNLQSDGKRKHRKFKDSGAILEDPAGGTPTDKISKSWECLDSAPANVKISFEKVHTPSKRPAPKPPKFAPKVSLFAVRNYYFISKLYLRESVFQGWQFITK